MNKKRYYFLGTMSTVLFIVLALLIQSQGLKGPVLFDHPLQEWAYSVQQHQGLTTFFSHLTNMFGDTGGVITAGLVALLLYFVVKERVGAIWFSGLIVFSFVLNSLVKHVIGRARPSIYRLAAFANEPGQSFPRGHSIFATVFFGSLFFIFLYRMKKKSTKITCGLLCLVMIGLIMFSRILVGVHYPTDTLAGFLEGLMLLMFTYPYFQSRFR